jgi:C4-dicarboxylate transporter DctM subunit
MEAALIIVLAIILIMIFSGVAMPFAFLAGCIAYALITGTSTASFIQTSFSAINSYSIIAMPMFMIAGTLIERSGIAKTLIEAAQKLVGRLKGGMAMTIPVVACFFGALSGSGTATCTTLSSMMVPDLEKQGYEKKYLGALIAAAAPLGYMIPPNVNAIIFNRVASSSSVAELFMATIVPGVIWALAYIILIRFGYKKYYHPENIVASEKSLDYRKVAQPKNIAVSQVVDVKHDITAAKKHRKDFIIGAAAAIGMPVIVMGGIYGGIFTSTEAGAIGSLYALLIGWVVFKKFTLKSVFKDFTNTGMSIGSLMILFPMTYIFSRILVLEQVPSALTDLIYNVSTNKYVILLMIDVILFIAGFFVDCSVLQLVFVPLLLPLCQSIGVSTTHLAVIMFVSIGVGTMTPPMAMNLFISARILKLPVKDVIEPIWPFVGLVGVPMLLLVTYVPALSEFLPKLLLKG